MIKKTVELQFLWNEGKVLLSWFWLASRPRCFRTATTGCWSRMDWASPPVSQWDAPPTILLECINHYVDFKKSSLSKPSHVERILLSAYLYQIWRNEMLRNQFHKNKQPKNIIPPVTSTTESPFQVEVTEEYDSRVTSSLPTCLWCDSLVLQFPVVRKRSRGAAHSAQWTSFSKVNVYKCFQSFEKFVYVSSGL